MIHADMRPSAINVLLAVVLAVAGCASHRPPGEPQPPAPAPRRDTLTLVINLGKLDHDYLIAMLKADGDFSEWQDAGTFQHKVRYTGTNVRLSIEDAAERASIRCTVRVDGHR